MLEIVFQTAYKTIFKLVFISLQHFVLCNDVKEKVGETPMQMISIVTNNIKSLFLV
jgi:hypothetical protein